MSQIDGENEEERQGSGEETQCPFLSADRQAEADYTKGFTQSRDRDSSSAAEVICEGVCVCVCLRVRVCVREQERKHVTVRWPKS